MKLEGSVQGSSMQESLVSQIVQCPDSSEVHALGTPMTWSKGNLSIMEGGQEPSFLRDYPLVREICNLVLALTGEHSSAL
jgi:hypothetical protein